MSRLRRSSLGYSGGTYTSGLSSGITSGLSSSYVGSGLPSSTAGYLSSPVAAASGHHSNGTGGTSSPYTSYLLRNSSTAAGITSSSFGTSNSAATTDYNATSSSAYSSPARRRYTGAATDSNLNDLYTSGVTSSSTTANFGTSGATTPSRPLRSYRGARSHQELSSLDSKTPTGGLTPTSNWRAKSITSNTDYSDRFRSSSRTSVDPDTYVLRRDRSSTRSEAGYNSYSSGRDRDLSLSRETSYRDRYPSGASARDDFTRDYENYVSSPRDRDRSLTREPYTPTRDYYSRPTSSARSIVDTSAMNGSAVHSPSTPQRTSSARRSRRVAEDYPTPFDTRGQPTSSQRYSSRTRNFSGFSGGPPLVKSSSFRDLRDLENEYHHNGSSSGLPSSAHRPPRNRQRHQTLAYGVSAADLGMARTMSRGSLNDLAAEWRQAQVPLVGAGTAASVVTFRGSNSDLRGFASDMSMGPNSQSMVGNSSSSSHGSRHRKGHSRSSHKKESPCSSQESSSAADLGYSSEPGSRRSSTLTLAPSLTIAELEREARGHCEHHHHHHLPHPPPAAVAGGGGQDDLIVLRKDDLNTILTAKPTLLIGRELSLSSEARGSSSSTSARTQNKSHNGSEVDYKKLWEESQKENGRLREDVHKMREDLGTAKRKLDTAVHSASNSTSGLSDTEKREKKALEKKLSEMEEELKQLEHLKNDNQRLRDENGALIRVISKLSK